MRIRTIKPEFWRSDDIDSLPIEDRLLFVGLWSYVDDSGVGVDKESAIAADLFAGDLSRDPRETSLRVQGGLKRLAEAGLITRYTVDGRRYLHVTNWAKHQKINRPTPSRYPPPTSENAIPHGERSEDSVSPQAKSTVGTGEQGNRGTGEQTRSTAAAVEHARPPARRLDGFADFWSAYPRRVGKRKAEQAYAAALKRGAKPEHLIAAAASYAARTDFTDPQFIAHPATWLNAARYDDEPDPERKQLSNAEQWQQLKNGAHPVVDAEVVNAWKALP